MRRGSSRSGMAAIGVGGGAVAVLLMAAMAASPAAADIYRLNNQPLPLLTTRWMAMYAPGDVEAGPPGNGESYIYMSLSFSAPPSDQTYDSFAEVLVLDEGGMDGVGVVLPGEVNRTHCCTTEILEGDVEVPGCATAEDNGRLIVDPRIKGWRQTVPIRPGMDTSLNNRRVPVNETGVQYLVIGGCAPAHVDGVTHWMNPYGYLPGSSYGFMPFYYWMSVGYMVAAAVWFAFNVYFFREVVMIQNCISVVLFMCLVEMTTWSYDYHTYNVQGSRHIGAFMCGTATSVLRRTLSRGLVVAVSLGYGVVRPTLGEDARRIGLLCALYFVFGLALELETNYTQDDYTAQELRGLLTVPVAALDAITYWWIFLALYSVMSQLSERRQEMKLSLYRSFSRVLITSCVVAAAFACFQMFFIYTNQVQHHWQWLWLFDAGFWQLVYTGILGAIMVLWRPSMNSRAYAYSAVGTDDPDDDVEMYGDYSESVTTHRASSPAPPPVSITPLFEVGDGNPDIDGGLSDDEDEVPLRVPGKND